MFTLKLLKIDNILLTEVPAVSK